MATLAVTIAGDEARAQAEEAAVRVRRLLGLHTLILDAGQLSDAEGSSPALRLFDRIPERWDRVMLFAPDWRPVRAWNPDLLFRDRGAIVAVPARVPAGMTVRALPPGTPFDPGWMLIPRAAGPLLERLRMPSLDLESPGFAEALRTVFSGRVTLAPEAFNVRDPDEWPDPANVMAIRQRGETGKDDRRWKVTRYDDPSETMLRNLDYRHRWTFDVEHIVELFRVASAYAGGTALDVGSFRGHCAVALALAGLRVTSIDISEEHRRAREGMAGRFFLDIDFRIEHSYDALVRPEQYDVILHDAHPRERILPELQAFWTRKLAPGGMLMMHNIENFDRRALLDVFQPEDHIVTADRRRRQLGYFMKPSAAGIPG
jgi:2-polyprenyl-3-methyl-5-hydroxy-6-metoxy-1,4-benzoquinol methylase